ncbi:MAG TPA: enoyl-CoA hydratase-related protein [Streptosporangiaceae bacterium]|nr:enoyl-CoA hydratase-related protein [Streptosporangiaceae bacterium]
MDLVTIHRHSADHLGVTEIVLNRPGALNAISTDLAAQLTDTCSQVASDQGSDGTRAVVLSASGDRAFCVGADLKERNAMSDQEVMAQRHAFRGVFGAVLGLPQPAVAAVAGYALGGGCELALSCDLIVADETAVFGLPETTVGLVPGGGGTQLALRRLGTARAADLVLTGRRVDIAEAERLGLVDRRVRAGTARTTALDLAGQIAGNSAVAVKAAKRALRQGWGIGLEAGLDIEDAAWRTAALSADRKEGIAAFNEKRRPKWAAGSGE